MKRQYILEQYCRDPNYEISYAVWQLCSKQTNKQKQRVNKNIFKNMCFIFSVLNTLDSYLRMGIVG